MDKILSWLRNIKIPLPKNVHLPRIRGIGRGQIALWGVALLVAIGVFLFLRGFTACWQLTALPGIPPATCPGATAQGGSGPIINAQGTDELPPPTPEEVAAPPVEYPQWDGGSRINIVFFGLRGGETAGEDCPLCTDTIIVFSVDPITKSAGMLSVPRDMFVNIPGFGYSRINTAWTDGEAAKLPGGGPALAMKTVSQFLGIPIQYYAQVDFQTFADFVDMIHGIDVYNDENLLLDISGPGYQSLGKIQANQKVTVYAQYKSGNFVVVDFAGAPGGKGWVLTSAVKADGLDKLPVVDSAQQATGSGISGTILRIINVRPQPGNPNKVRLTPGGIRHLNGQVALAFARCRDQEQGCSDGDVGRSKRQQKVILAIRDKVLSPQYFPTLMAEAPQLYNLFSAGIHTNLSLQDGLKLAALAQQIPLDQIRQGVVANNMVNYGNVTLGGQNAAILMPIPDKIRELRDQIFGMGGSTNPMAQGDPRSLMVADAARVCIADNTGIPGLLQRTGNFLLAQGMNVAPCAATGGSTQTVVVLYSPKLYTLRFLMNPVGMITSSNQILFRPDASQPYDVEIRLGADWASRLPAGY